MAGVIDFTQARVLEKRWWWRSGLLIRAMEDRDALIWLQAAHDYQCALLSNSDLKEDSFENGKKRAHELFHAIMKCVQPWVTRSSQEIREEQNAKLAQLYREMVGDPNDPEFQAKMAHDAAMAEAKKNATVREDPETTLNKALEDRDRILASRRR